MDEQNTWSQHLQLYSNNNLVNSRSTLKMTRTTTTWKNGVGKWTNEVYGLHWLPCHHGHNNMGSRLMFQPDENCSTEDGIRIEPTSNNKISMRSPSNAITDIKYIIPMYVPHIWCLQFVLYTIPQTIYSTIWYIEIITWQDLDIVFIHEFRYHSANEWVF